MYDLLAEIFVYGVALVYLILFMAIAQYWVRNMVRKRGVHNKTASSAPLQAPDEPGRGGHS